MRAMHTSSFKITIKTYWNSEADAIWPENSAGVRKNLGNFLKTATCGESQRLARKRHIAWLSTLSNSRGYKDHTGAGQRFRII